MKQFAVVVLLAAGLVLIGCGSNSSNHGSINGRWNATLTDTNNATVFSLGTNLVVSGDGTLAVTNFSFSTSSPCFLSGGGQTGSFALSGDFNGNLNGTFGFVVQSGSPVGDTLTLTGTANGNTISGTWTLTGGRGCTGNGNFIMTKM